MMKVTNKTHGMLAQIRHERHMQTNGYWLQRKLKSGAWGKARWYDNFGCEHCAEDVIARLEHNNPGDVYRVAETCVEA